MFSPTRLIEMMVEVVFLLLGALVIWLGLLGRITVERHGVAWLAISVAILAWGLLALARPGDSRAQMQRWNRGLSLLLLGVIMLVITRVPFVWVGKLLALGGVVMLIRGLLGSLLILKPR
jgi:hypothetical protein